MGQAVKGGRAGEDGEDAVLAPGVHLFQLGTSG